MIHQIAVRTANTGTAQHAPVVGIRAGARPYDLIELQLYLRGGHSGAAAPAMTGTPTAGFALGLVEATTLSTPSTSTVVRNRRRVGGVEAGLTALVTAWSGAPVLDSSNYLDRRSGGTQIGYPIIFALDRLDKLVMGDSGSAAGELWIALTEAHGTAPVFDAVLIVDE